MRKGILIMFIFSLLSLSCGKKITPVVGEGEKGGITGVVRSGGKGIDGVDIIDTGGGGSTSTSQDGKFLLSELDPGEHEVLITKERYIGRTIKVIVEAGRIKDVGEIEILQAGSIKGYIKDDKGTPLVGVDVSITGIGVTKKSGEDGGYYFSDLPPGKYEVVAGGNKIVVEVKGGEIANAQDIILPSGSGIPGLKGRIAFLSRSYDGWWMDLYVLDLSKMERWRKGSGIRYHRGSFEWHPDGRRGLVLFFLPPRGIHIIDMETGGILLRISEMSYDRFPRFSPDGTKVVYTSERGFPLYPNEDPNEVGVLKPHFWIWDGSATFLISRTYWAGDDCPAWSPDGRRIALVVDQDKDTKNYELYLAMYNYKESVWDMRRLTKANGWDYEPSWSPDGNSIAFTSERDGNSEIYLLDILSEKEMNLTKNRFYDGDPQWSPDGSKIAFTSYRDGNLEIYVMDHDGGNLRNLTRNKADDWNPRWSPDGEWIAFISNRMGNQDIFVMRADGSDQRNVTMSPEDEYEPSWALR